MAHIELSDIELSTLIDCIVTEISDAETEAEDNESFDFKAEMAEYISQLITIRTKLES